MSNQTKFGKPVAEIISTRISVRNYRNEILPDDVINKLNNYIRDISSLFDVRLRIEIIIPEIAKDMDVKLGTYGVIRGTSYFFALAVEKSELYLEYAGDILEHVVLYATSLGLGTCWLAGFKRSEFARAVSLRDNELLPVIIAVGYPKEGLDVLGLIRRSFAGSKSRKPWNELFFNKDFSNSLSSEEAGEFSDALEMLRLAPSASNKQPWRVVQAGNRYHFYIKHNPGYSVSRDFDIQHMDIGIGMCHFQLAAEESGLRGKWEIAMPVMKDIPPYIDYVISWVGK